MVEEVTKSTETVEEEAKCTKKACRIKEKELSEKLTKTELEKLKMNNVWLQEVKIRSSFLIKLMSLIGDTFGEDFYNKIIEHIAKEREAMKSFQAIKDEKGLELKCSFCEIVIKGSSELKIDADFFKALDKNFYCADCYEKKYPQEFSEKYQKVSQQNQTQTRVEITGSESEEIDKTESADSSKEK